MYPAYSAFAKDVDIGFARWRVYMALQPPVLDFMRPVDIKIGALARSIPLHRDKVRDALNWLTKAGYIVEHGRNSRGVRQLTIAYAVTDRRPSVVVQATMTAMR